MSCIITAPTVSYRCKLINKPEIITVENPIDAPGTELVDYYEESIVSATIITPSEYSSAIKKLCDEKRGFPISQEFLNQGKVVHFQYEIPLAELITDFFDQLKSISSGYASLDYEHKKF